MEYVDVCILEGEEDGEEVIPATLEFSGYDGEGGGLDYEGIEEVKVDAFYKMKY